MSTFKAWIEAMRLRTLPASMAGVIVGTGCAIADMCFRPLPAIICLIFALLAQIASNFANEYFDFKNGLDRKGREGFRRGVTEGDLTPKAMRNATFGTLALACLVGLSLVYYGGWWLIFIGIAVALFAIAYSAGPYPLSHHGLGDIAVVIFFGIVPVMLTAYVQAGDWSGWQLSLPMGIATGLLTSLILIVNNYRDANDDAAVGKRTTVVIFGRKTMARVYLAFAYIGTSIMLYEQIILSHRLRACIWTILLYIAYWKIYRQLTAKQGSALNPVLGLTAKVLLVYSIFFLMTCIFAQLYHWM